MLKTTFEITKMDCPSEENLIRLKLNDISSVKSLDFDIPNRILYVFHDEQLDRIEDALSQLKLGCKTLKTEQSDQVYFEETNHQKKLLWTVLIINFAFFFIEMTTGLVSKSMGLIADSMDMLADAFVYGISILAVGSSLIRKKQIAKLAGYFQIILALLGFIEVVQRFMGTEEIPVFSTMMIVSVLALIANGYCLYIMQQSSSKKDAHMQASLIFTSNDIVINIGVIAAGALVYWLDSSYPDLIIGSIVFAIVLKGAFRILKIA